MKILLNAESFGFGPSASISIIFNIINQFSHLPNLQIDYIGSGHSLDLQSSLPYHNIFHYDENLFTSIIKNYDFFITALDFEKARLSKTHGVKTIVYDTLLWYWPDKNFVHYADYYITQNFYDVNTIVHSLKLKNFFIIPPLVQKRQTINHIDNDSKDLLLINFGGLENPFWNIDITVQYIDNILSTLLPIVQQQFKNIKIVCSQNHLPFLTQYPVTTASYNEMQDLLQRAKYIIATSGLGNIYEIANYKIPSLFLPPVNDSQGQQLQILFKAGLIDNFLDWSCFQHDIDYFDSQKNVLDNISQQIFSFNKESFQSIINQRLNHGNLNLDSIFDKFGYNGCITLSHILNHILH